MKLTIDIDQEVMKRLDDLCAISVMDRTTAENREIDMLRAGVAGSALAAYFVTTLGSGHA